MFLPVFNEVAEEVDTKLVTINVDDNQEIAMSFGVQGIPAVFFVKEGKVIMNTAGFMDADKLKEFIEKFENEK
jgi:thioredoxin-like negative regulator of GroEL